jgi:hypothetical protein
MVERVTEYSPINPPQLSKTDQRILDLTPHYFHKQILEKLMILRQEYILQLKAREKQILEDEVSFQEEKYGESSLGSVLKAFGKLTENELFGLTLQPLNQVGKEIINQPFEFQGNRYLLEWTLQRNEPLGSLTDDGFFLFSRLSIVHTTNHHFQPLQRIFLHPNEVAASSFGVIFNSEQEASVQATSTARQPRNTKESEELVFRGAGRALMMLRDLTIRDLANRFPQMSSLEKITSYIEDDAWDIEKGENALPFSSSMTNKAFLQMGYEFNTNMIGLGYLRELLLK